MRLAFILIAIFFSTYCNAESWLEPSGLSAISRNGEYVLRVLPGDAESGAKSRALVYRLDGDAYKIASEFSLPNRIQPVDVVISSRGKIVALDDWGAVGWGEHVIAAYETDGTLLAAKSIEDLYTNEEISRMKSTAGSRWWHSEEAKLYAFKEYAEVADAFGIRVRVEFGTGIVDRIDEPEN